MKLIRLLALPLVTILTATAQNTYPFPSSGNVGIGTSSPWTSLHIQGPFTPGAMQLMVQSTGSDDRQGIAFYNAAGQRTGIIYTGPASGGDFIFGREQSGMFRFFSGGGERLTIDSIGNVGIGLSNPSATLQTRSATNKEVQIGSTSGAFSTATHYTDLSTLGSVINLSRPSDGAFAHSIFSYTSTAGGANLGIAARSDIKFVVGAIADRGMIIKESGNVGIGTMAPNQKLSVEGNLSVGTTGSFIMMGESAFTGGGGYIFLKSTGNYGRDFNIQNYSNAAGWRTNLFVAGESGNVGIGETNPAHKLAVNGTIKAKEVIVETTGWSDYVFADEYRLAPLSEVEAHIKANKHLPGIPSASDVAANGVSIGELQAKLLAKIEELTLHQIAQEKELVALRAEVRSLRQAAIPAGK